MTTKNPRDDSNFLHLAWTASPAAPRPADRHPRLARAVHDVPARLSGAGTRALRPALSFALAAASLLIAANAQGWDPMDAAGPPPDDPAAWHDERAPARVSQELERCAALSGTDGASIAQDDPSAHHGGSGAGCGRLVSACAQLERARRGGDLTAPSGVGSAPGSAGSGAPAVRERTFSSIPPWFGSEPYVFGFEEIPARPQTQIAPRHPTLATSLGSEPFPAGSGDPSPAGDVTPVQRPTAPATLAASLGSEPFILEGAPPDETALAQARQEQARKELARQGR